MLDLLREACDRIGRTLDPGPLLEGWVRDAGFQNVHHRRFPLPIGTWPKDRRMVSFCIHTLIGIYFEDTV